MLHCQGRKVILCNISRVILYWRSVWQDERANYRRALNRIFDLTRLEKFQISIGNFLLTNGFGALTILHQQFPRNTNKISSVFSWFCWSGHPGGSRQVWRGRFEVQPGLDGEGDLHHQTQWPIDSLPASIMCLVEYFDQLQRKGKLIVVNWREISSHWFTHHMTRTLRYHVVDIK